MTIAIAMAVEDFLKLLPDSNLRGHSTSHIVGFLSVLAISGSVALFTLSAAAKRSFHSIHDADAANAAEVDSDSDELLSLEAFGDGDDNDDLRVPEVSAAAPPSEAKNHASRKKHVHFAEDVKEPCGDSREYRLRSAQRGDNQEACALRRRCCRNQMPANRVALYKGLRQYRQELAASSYMSH